jgi:putative membrane protein
MQRALSRAAAGATLILSAATLTACSDDDDPVGPDNITQQVINSIQTDGHIMGALHESNLGEINAGELAQATASDAEVKAFATEMVNVHTTADAQGTTVAAQLGITPTLPNDLLSDRQHEELAQLARTTGTTFDRTYIAQQIMTHLRTIALVDASITKAHDPTLKLALQHDVRPRLVEHLRAAQMIRNRIGAP